MTTPIALAIAGSDPSGGAGIQADLKTFAALEVYGASVVTALTAQNTRGVRSVFAPPVAVVAAQLEAVLDDLEIGAVKIGMLGEPAVIPVITALLARFPVGPIVLDPVLRASDGTPLLCGDGSELLRGELLPRTALLTPNIPEAAELLGATPEEVARDPLGACEGLLALGPSAVLLKGGHAEGNTCADWLLERDKEVAVLSAERLFTDNTHGTGCTLSAAIAAELAHGSPLRAAAARARAYLAEALGHADELRVGRGHGPLHHQHAQWNRPPSHRDPGA